MKIAIIGSGISGLGAAYLLNEAGHDITVYEKNHYIGGHSRTMEVAMGGKNIPVDTGFIVFNYRNYPELTSMFKHLSVAVEKSDMSFGASIKNGWFEYGTQKPSAIFTQKRNIFRPQFWKMMRDIFKFNANAKKYIDSNITLGECLAELKLGDWFKNYYLLAMGGAIWSTPTNGMLDFPVRSFIRFFDNHGLITINDQPQWYTVTGGSREYVKKLTASFKDKILLNCGAQKVIRENNKVKVIDSKGNEGEFDQVVFACHSDQAMKILQNPTQEEKAIIGAVKYQPNKAILHCDESFMPKRKGAWASWVYLSDVEKDDRPQVSLSYWMNRLQNITSHKPIIVTLNPSRMPEKSTIFDEHIFEHPVFDEAAISAQERIDSIQGLNNTWYCGAYLKYGFHEDGFASGVKVAEKIGAKIPWR